MTNELKLGYQYLTAGNLSAAQRVAARVLQQKPDSGQGLQLAGLIAYQNGDLSAADHYLSQAAKNLSSDPNVYAQWGAVCAGLGRTFEAIQHFRRALELDGDHLDSHYNLGGVLQTAGELDEAIAHYRTALRLRPGFFQAAFNLANALRDAGHLTESVAAYEQALRLKPDYAKALNNLGNVLVRLGDCAAAVAAFDRALALRPDYAEGYHNRGNAFRAMPDREQAMDSYRRALAINPASPKTHVALADLLKEEYLEAAIGHYRQAIQHYQATTASLPTGHQVKSTVAGHKATVSEFDLVRAWNNLGSCLVVRRDWAEAEACFHFVLSLDAANSIATNNLGVIRMSSGRLDEAQRLFEEAIALDNDYAEAHSNLAATLQNQGLHAQAEPHYDRALTVDPELADAHWNRALLWLAKGDWSRGWEEYESRWQRPEFCRQQFRCPPGSKVPKQVPRGVRAPQCIEVPLWDGSRLDDRTIMLFTEQGLGDVIQFVRFAATVKAHGGRVVVEGPKGLLPLLRSYPGVDQWIAQGEAPPQCDFQLPLLSVPKTLDITPSDLPRSLQYLRPDPARVAKWKSTLDAIPGFRIGVNWQGNPTYHLDRFRSLPLAEFRPLVAVPRTTLISLQQGFGAEQAVDVQELFDVQSLGLDIDREGGSFMDTAAILTLLDLVVTSDTALAHLAGALGVPVWVVLPYAADWRWGLSGEDCSWYPTMRLFRQQKLGDWKPVFQRVANEVRILLSEKL